MRTYMYVFMHVHVYMPMPVTSFIRMNSIDDTNMINVPYCYKEHSIDGISRL